jgi:hypothetical protein
METPGQEGPRRTRIGFAQPVCGVEEEEARAEAEGREAIGRAQLLQRAVVERTHLAPSRSRGRATAGATKA